MASTGRTVLIGDVHGCIDELERLLAALAVDATDRVILVGDLVAKGPDSASVVRLARERSFECVLGNHDEFLLRFQRARDAGAAMDAPEAVRRTARALDADDWAWLDALPLTIDIAEHHAIAVHAGLVPGVPLGSQRAEHLLTMRSIRPDGSATKRLEEGVPWASLWPGPTHVFFGHDAVRGLQRHPFATGLDTGCVYGRHLTAMVLPDRRLVSVPAKKAYADAGRGDKRR